MSPDVETEQELTNCLPSYPLGGEVLKQTFDTKLAFPKVSLETNRQPTSCLPSNPRGGEVRKQTLDTKLALPKTDENLALPSDGRTRRNARALRGSPRRRLRCPPASRGKRPPDSL